MTCKVSGCTNIKIKALGLCQMHYIRYKKHGHTDKPLKIKKIKPKCSADGCENTSKFCGFCTKHYQRMRKNNTTELVVHKTKRQTLLEENQSYCSTCKCIKDVGAFSNDKTTSYGISMVCRECKNKKQRAYFANNETKRKEHMLRQEYGLTLEDYNNMIKFQESKCPICHKQLEVGTKNVHVDHDHKTGRVRAILCSKCNHVLGLCLEDISILEEAILYIKKYSSSLSIP